MFMVKIHILTSSFFISLNIHTHTHTLYWTNNFNWPNKDFPSKLPCFTHLLFHFNIPIIIITVYCFSLNSYYAFCVVWWSKNGILKYNNIVIAFYRNKFQTKFLFWNGNNSFHSTSIIPKWMAWQHSFIVIVVKKMLSVYITTNRII